MVNPPSTKPAAFGTFLKSIASDHFGASKIDDYVGGKIASIQMDNFYTMWEHNNLTGAVWAENRWEGNGKNYDWANYKDIGRMAKAELDFLLQRKKQYLSTIEGAKVDPANPDSLHNVSAANIMLQILARQIQEYQALLVKAGQPVHP